MAAAPRIIPPRPSPPNSPRLGSWVVSQRVSAMREYPSPGRGLPEQTRRETVLAGCHIPHPGRRHPLPEIAVADEGVAVERWIECRGGKGPPGVLSPAGAGADVERRQRRPAE